MADYEQKSYKGGAVGATLAVDIDADDLTIVLNTAAGWPDGSDGPFVATIDRAGTVEKVRVTSRSGTTLTLADVTDRGYDDTAAVGHTHGVAVEHTFSSVDAREANAVAVATLGKITGKGSLLAGTAANALDEVAPGADGQVPGYNASSPTGITPMDVATPSDIATLTAAVATLNSEVAALQSEETAEDAAWTAYTPAISAGGALGNGTVKARYAQVGKTVRVVGRIALGTTTTVGGVFNISLPVAAQTDYGTELFVVGIARGHDNSGDLDYPGQVVVVDVNTFSVKPTSNSGTSDGTYWGTTYPFTWASSDIIRFEFTYEAA